MVQQQSIRYSNFNEGYVNVPHSRKHFRDIENLQTLKVSFYSESLEVYWMVTKTPLIGWIQ